MNFHQINLGGFNAQLFGAIEVKAKGLAMPDFLIDAIFKESDFPPLVHLPTAAELDDMQWIVRVLDDKADEVAAKRANGEDPGDVVHEVADMMRNLPDLKRGIAAIKRIVSNPNDNVRITAPNADDLMDGRPERAKQRSELQRRTQKLYDSISAVDAARMQDATKNDYESSDVLLSNHENLAVSYEAVTGKFELAVEANGQRKVLMASDTPDQLRTVLKIVPPRQQFLGQLDALLSAGRPSASSSSAATTQPGTFSQGGNATFNYGPIDLTADVPPAELPDVNQAGRGGPGEGV